MPLFDVECLIVSESFRNVNFQEAVLINVEITITDMNIVQLCQEQTIRGLGVQQIVQIQERLTNGVIILLIVGAIAAHLPSIMVFLTMMILDLNEKVHKYG